MLNIIFVLMMISIILGVIMDLLFHKKYTFIILVICLFIAQLCIVKPGIYINWGGEERYYKIFGMSLSSIISMIFIIYMSFSIFIMYLDSKWNIPLSHIIILGVPILLLIIELVIGKIESITQISEFLKIYFPLELYVYIDCVNLVQKINVKTMVIFINMLLIVQTWICRILNGKFCITIFYPELSQEFYGYYNSPHPLSACLCVLSVMLIYFYFQDHKKSHLFIFVLNQIYIFLLNVTSYMALELIAIVMIFALSTIKEGNKTANLYLQRYIWLTIFIIPVVVYFLFQTRLYDNYIAGNITNGRTSRLMIDINYFLNHYNFVELLFGKGFYSIYRINRTLIEAEINSLNYFVDMLFDVGIIGIFSFTLTSLFAFFKLNPRKNNTFYYALLIFLIGGMISNNIFPYLTVTLLMVLCMSYMKNAEEVSYEQE